MMNDGDSNRRLLESAAFLKGVVDAEGLPFGDRPEVCFAGRSNVGKSSLINALTGKAGLARTSNTPGRTREINFFSLSDENRALYLVDLPGYGYAKASKGEVKAWNRLIMNYLKGRPTLSRVFLLVDARHGLKDNDRSIMGILDDVAVSYQIVLTKLDKLKRDEQEKVLASVSREARRHVACHPDVLATSSLKGWGMDMFMETVAGMAGALS